MSIALETGRSPPLGGDHGVAGRRWMHAVARPVRRWGAAHLLVEDRLERHERRAGMRRDPRRGRAPPVELREPAIIHRAGLEDERLEHDELHVWQRLPGLVEQRRVLLLVILDRTRIAVRPRGPEIVDADQTAR